MGSGKVRGESSFRVGVQAGPGAKDCDQSLRARVGQLVLEKRHTGSSEWEGD